MEMINFDELRVILNKAGVWGSVKIMFPWWYV